MATRKIKNAKDITTDELIYFKGHAQATFMSDGRTVEDAINGINGSNEIFVTDYADLQNLDVPVGTKATVFKDAQVYDNLNLGKMLSGTETNPIPPADGSNLFFEITSIDTDVQIYYNSEEEHLLRVSLPIQNDVHVYCNNDGTSIQSISARSGYLERVWHEGVWILTSTSYIHGIYLYDFTELNDIQIRLITAIAPALNGKFTIAPKSYEYIKTSDGWISFNTSEIYNVLDIITSSKQATLISGENIKTVNGESILGSGDITISGGSSNSAYSEVSHGTSDTTFTLTPNVFHIWDEVTELNISLGSETSGVANEYLFQFTSGSEPTALSLPDDIKWANDSAPTITENMIYQVSILKGLGSVLEFSNAAILIENHITYNAGDLMNGGTITFEYPTASELTLNMSYYHSSTLIVPQGSTQVNVDWNEPSSPVIRGISPTEDSTYKYIL